MTVFNNTLLLGDAATGSEIQISRSLRFNSADTATLSRVFPSIATNQKLTYSTWIKRSNSGAQAVVSTDRIYATNIEFTSSDNLRIYTGDPFLGIGSFNWTSAQVFRDFGSWFHVLVAWDTTNATAGDRVSAYINGQKITTWSIQNTITQNMQLGFSGATSKIGLSNTASYFNGYFADVYLIDGQTLTPASFAETNATTGQWVPKAYTGTYGANGFKLTFSDNSNNTTTTLGKDTSGNGNNWTPNNLSVTIGSGNDSLVDTPTSYGADTGVGGEVRGNYSVLNPLHAYLATTTNGGLDCTTATGWIGSTQHIETGKWYAEFTVVNANLLQMFGVCTSTHNATTRPWQTAGAPGVTYYVLDGRVYVNGSLASTVGGAAVNNIISVAIDVDTRSVVIRKNNVIVTTQTIGVASSYMFYVSDGGTSSTATVNFGQRPFAYTAPSGYKALCDTNLPTPVIAKPALAMDAVTYTGTGAALTPTSSLGFSPDLVWIKARSGVGSEHTLYDILRGAQTRLEPSTTIVEPASDNGLTAFNSSGFTLGTLAQVNTNTTTYVAWCWDFGSANTVNTQGTISSTIRANTSAGSAIATYTGTGANATVGHGLGIAPSLIIIKRRNTAVSNWQVRHSSVAAANSIQLNLTNPAAAAATVWNSTAPTSTVFSVGTDASVNASGGLYVAYCFAAVSGYSSFGGYTGNLSLDGPFVYTGFRPRWVMIKQTTAASATGWVIVDSARLGYNVDNNPLFANSNAIEATTDLLDITSTGFKIRSTDASVNASAGTYIYAAFAESPFQYSRAR